MGLSPHPPQSSFNTLFSFTKKNIHFLETCIGRSPNSIITKLEIYQYLKKGTCSKIDISVYFNIPFNDFTSVEFRSYRRNTVGCRGKYHECLQLVIFF